jgi:hypothetical protein
MKTLYKVLFTLSILGSTQSLIPEPTGAFVTGAQDFEFLDTIFPSPFAEDSSGRRIMFRAYYPVCHRTDFSMDNNTCNGAYLGRQRLYFEEGEWDAYFGAEAGLQVLKTFASSLKTFSYLNAPMVVELGPRPIIIYNHGATQWVSDNTALCEELASQGYAVFALGLPGFASGVLYPNGETANISNDFDATLTDPNNSLLPQSPDIQVRYEKLKRTLTSDSSPAVFLPRYRDDMLAMVDYLLSPSNNSTLLKALVGEGELKGLIYMGFSFGGAAAGSAAHQDERANGAINIDGSHQSTDLLGSATRVPVLAFAQNAGFFSAYYNEFFYEELEDMGTNPDVMRVLMPTNTTHSDFTLLRFFPLALREAVGSTSVVDGERLHAILVDFIVGFVDTTTGLRSDWTPSESFSKFQDDVKSIDVSYVADWAQNMTSAASGGTAVIPLYLTIAYALMTM